MKRTRVLVFLFADAARGWMEHRAQRLGASLAFYTTLALAPLTVIAITVAGSFFGEEAARGAIVHQIEFLVGKEGAVAIEGVIQKAREPRQSRIATVLSVAFLLVASTGVFAELKGALDTIWEVKRKPGLGLWTIAKTQALAFATVVGTGFLLLVSLLLTTALSALSHWLGQWLPETLSAAYFLDLTVSFIVITLLFASIFKLLPDVTVRWRDVWIGAVFTTLLFMVGKSLIGMYIGTAGIGSIYGAAGSVIVILVWTYYSAQIVFFGAELIRAYAVHIDPKPLEPTDQAVPMEERELLKQGMPEAAHRHADP